MGDSNSAPLSPLKQAYLAIEKLQARLEAQQEPVAIIGMGCRFPGGVDSPEAFWRLLHAGVDAVTPIPADRWDMEAFYDPDPHAPGKISTRYGAFLQHIDQFDPQFFGISPREAQSMDPQQRLLLEVTWEALENAGCAPDQLHGSRTGVFVGMTSGDYNHLFLHEQNAALLDAYYLSGVARSIASGRISYILGLQGPSLTVDTACSSSLVTVHLAVQSLRANECRVALAGGVNLILSPENYVTISQFGMLAADGRCKTFDASADGFVRGEGCGMVVLKRLSDALADGDPILAVIRGSAVNQDGASSGLTAPNSAAQETVIRDALANGRVEPGQISYVEAHGTGTSLGDPIEIGALSRTLRAGKLAQQPLVVGSVKTNVGHLESAAGIASLIKVVMMLQHRQIPAHLHLKTPNPFIRWDQIPLVIPSERQAWEGVEGRLMAGVSSFGFSGTNAHVIVEAAPLVEPKETAVERPLHILALSARSQPALDALSQRYSAHLHDDDELADIAYSANTGRSHLEYRRVAIGATAADMRASLAALADAPEPVSADQPRIVFLFTGQGSQYVGMGRRLYETQPTFRAVLDQCTEVLKTELDQPLLDVLFPAQGEPALLDDTAYTQPALFALEYALAQMWLAWGIQPAAVMGHSVGEYVAACIAGVFSLEDGLRLIAARGRLMSKLPSGGVMAAVFADETRVQAAIAPYTASVSIAAVNGPENVVISGDRASVNAVIDLLKQDSIRARFLTVSHAFHSPLMDPILDEFEAVASGIQFSAPRIKLISNLTGGQADIPSARYWREHVRQPVRFADSIDTLRQQGYGVFLEVGPGTTLIGMGQRIAEGTDAVGLWLSSLKSGQDDWAVVLATLGTLYTHGVNPDWASFDREYNRRKVTLPNYPFQRERYWFTKKKTRPPLTRATKLLHPLLGYRLDSAMKAAQFEMQFDAAAFDFLNDHQVHVTAILPATGYVELAMAAAEAVFGHGTHAVENLFIHQALVMQPDAVRTAQCIVTPNGDQANFEYFSRGDEDKWTLHATGTLVKHTADQPAVVDMGAIRARCDAVVSGAQHYAHLANLGLNFGDSLRGVVEIHRREGEALGEIQLPVEAGSYHIHPALLDACLQTLAWALPDQQQLYLPISMGEFRLYGRAPEHGWSYAQIAPDGQAGLVRGDIQLLDDSGQVVAEVKGLALRLAAPQQFGRRDYGDWLYQVDWQPQDLTLPAPDQLAASLTGQFDDGRQVVDAYWNGISPELDQLSGLYIQRALVKLGWKPQVGETFMGDSLAVRLHIARKHSRLFNRLLDILAEDELLERAGAGWRVCQPFAAADPAPLWAKAIETYPAHEPELTLLRWCGDELAGALRGQVDASTLLFPDGGAMAERLYRQSPVGQIYNRIAAEVIRAAADQRPLRILELGAGTGGTTVHILPALPPEQTQYTFTDISPTFVTRAEASFSAYPFMRYGVLNIETDPAQQGFTEQYDVVIATNMIHATANLATTFEHVRRLLAPGGMLVMIELIERERWFDVTFGLTSGWWGFNDLDVRPDYPLLNLPTWINVLRTAGFEAIETLPDYGHQAVFLARHPARKSIEGQRWLVLADRSGVALAVADGLRESGGLVELVDAASAPDYRQLIAGQPLQGVIYARGLDAVGQAGDPDAEQEWIVGSALNLIQALIAENRTPRLYMITGQVVSGDYQGVAQSTLWGMSKSLTLEYPELRPTMIDLDSLSDGDRLLDEILCDSPENQIVYQRGKRLVGRLHDHPSGADAVTPQEPWRLRFTQRGTLDNLEFAPVERRVPGEGEVEVRVYATGLNFRDVLNVLGTYPGEAGDPGSECSGVVTAIGTGVTNVQVGDAVIAVTAGSFASHVVVPAEMVFPKPATLTFEQAAGFVVPFLTASFTLHHLGGMRAGDKVLIHAAAGGVGLAAVQLALHAGAEIFATAGSPDKRAYLQSLGVAHVMNSRTLDFADEIMHLTGGKGVDLVLNSLAGDFIPASLSVLAENGRFLEIGKSGLLSAEEAAVRQLDYHVVDWSVDLQTNPMLIRALIEELLDGVTHGQLKPLPQQVFPIEGVVDALRFMQTAKHTGKIIVSQMHQVTRWEGDIRADGSYLITGGLRGLGLLTAEWLVERGARHLLLMGRHAPSEAAQAKLRDLEDRGAQIVIVQGDVAQAADVNRAFDALADMPPLRGVMHAAGVLDDGAISSLNWSNFRNVFGPKVYGAWHLHERTRQSDLDFFVLFSSIASLVGSAGQSNHAAANAFLDALAHHRQALGLPGLSINWGVWSEVGAAVDRGLLDRAAARGMGLIHPADGLIVLEQLMRGTLPQVGVMPVNWTTFAPALTNGNDLPMLRDILLQADIQDAAQGAPSTQTGQPELLTQLQGAKPAQQRVLLTQYVSGHARKVLGLKANSAVNERKPLSELGLDSLMAVELRNLLNTGLGLKRSLPATLVFDYPTIEAIVEYLVRDVLGLDTAVENQAAPAVENPLDAIEDLSDDEIDRLLQARMKSTK